MEPPALSVILAAAGPFSSVAGSVRHLQQQTIVGDIELIITVSSAQEFTVPEESARQFHAVRLVRLERVLPIHLAFAAGVPHATANVIAFTEDHVFAEPRWAEALVKRHREQWAVVGPVVRNANPQTATSIADFTLAYGLWSEGHASGPAEILPGHNSSYKREALLRAGSKLPEHLEAESVFHDQLRREGAELFLESEAVIRHLNFARLEVLLRLQWRYARQYAGRRSATWPVWRRLLYFFATPLVPIVRFRRLRRVPMVLPPQISRVRVLGILWLSLIADGFGQMLGYLCGIGRTAEYLAAYEYGRTRFS